MFKRVTCFALVFGVVLSGCVQTQGPAPVYRYDKKNSRKQHYSGQYYVVKPGDTLYSVGSRLGYNYLALAKWNNLSPPYVIEIGQRLKLLEKAKKISLPRPVAIKKPPKHRTPSQNRTKNTPKPSKKPIASQKSKTIVKHNEPTLKLSFQWPLKGMVLKTFSQPGHKGIDIQGQYGQPVVASEAGTVVYSGKGFVGYENLIIIKHNDSLLTAYANNRLMYTQDGQGVKKGEKIAEVGKKANGIATLYFEMREKGKPVNPINYLPK